MKNGKSIGLLIGLAGVLLWTLVGAGQVVELTRWALPGANALPFDIAISPDGMVYFTEFSLNKVGQLDPATNEIRERNVGQGPAGLVLGDTGSLYFTLSLDNALELLVFIGGGAKWTVPTAGSWPEVLVPAPTGPGRVNLWLNERNTRKIARFSPVQIAVTLPLIIAPPTPVTPIMTEISPVLTPVTPEVHPGNPMLPPPIALLVPTSSGPFTEWQSMITDEPLERVAVAPDGRVWFTQGPAPISVLDPGTNTVLLYGIPVGTSALGVTVAGDGRVWFTDTGRPAIGVLDPATADVRLWPIPGGSQPFELALDDVGNVWFTDREGNAVGYLSPARNEIAMYRMPANSHPLFLTLDPAGNVWFTAERGNFIGRLSIVPVLGEPPVLPSTGFRFLGYGITQVGNRAWASVSYAYDGSAGAEIFIGAEVLRGGAVLSGFVSPAVRVEGPGIGTVDLVIEYRGTTPVTSDQIRFTASHLPWPPPLAVQEVEFPTTWTP